MSGGCCESNTWFNRRSLGWKVSVSRLLNCYKTVGRRRRYNVAYRPRLQIRLLMDGSGEEGRAKEEVVAVGEREWEAEPK